LFILIFLAITVGGSLTLYALRTTTIRSVASFRMASREAFLLVNNILLVIAMALVLLGTLYPLAYEVVTGGDKISVGVPYFNAGFVPLMLILAAALGVAPALNWKRTSWATIKKRLGVVLVASLVLGLGLPLVLGGAIDWRVALTLMLAFWILGSHGRDFVQRARKRSLPLAYLGMLLAHTGFALTLMGVALTSELSMEKDLRMAPEQSVELDGRVFRFLGVNRVSGSNYLADQGEFVVMEGDRRLVMRPEKRTYLAGRNTMTEAAIDAGLFRDVYLSLGEPLEDGAWAVRIQVKPFVRWIWLGGLLMALGGCVAIADRRYRRLKQRLSGAVPLAAG